jgi:tetratricopeptide (TPR) repeat protein
VRFMQDKLKSCEQLAASLQLEAENLKKANKDLEVQAFNTKVQKEQEVALTKAQLEQLNALKEGEYVQLNNRFQEYRSTKDLELKGLNDSIAKLKLELQNSQDLSFQMVQEKSSFQGREKQISDQLKELLSQKSLLEQQKLDLEKQNVFLKNQYVTATQELDSLKKETTALAKSKVPTDMENCRRELDSLKSQISEKDREYLKKIKEYESKYKDIGSLDKDKGALINDLARLKNNYEELQARYTESEKSRKAMEALKERYGKLPEENANLHYNLGVVYAQHQEYPKAIAELEKVIQLKPNDPEAFYNLGVINGEYLGNRTKAIEYFEKYLALAPNDPEADRIRKYIVTWKTFGQSVND